jgi:tetratricopeptide (TPR) repeat protein
LTTKAAALAAIAVIGLSAASACGPGFQVMLTKCEHCRDTISAPALRSVLAPVIAEVPDKLTESEESESTTNELEVSNVTPEVSDLIASMRQSSTGDEAFARGNGVPDAVRLYIAGAVDFLCAHTLVSWGESPQSSQSNSKLSDVQVQTRLTAAIEWFGKVVDLPRNQSGDQLLWAEYMLGRSYRLRAGPTDFEAAQMHFERVVELVSAGMPDPLSLQNAALGELGGIAFTRGQLESALQLYARQSTSPGAIHSVNSLFVAASSMFAESNNDFDSQVDHPLTQKLLVTFAFSAGAVPRTADSVFFEADNGGVARLLRALKKMDPEQVMLPDRVAALAYERGDYDFATRIVAFSDAPFADWVRAKLFLHRGDLQEAAAAYARAASHFPQAPDADLPADLGELLHAEGAIVSLARGEYVDALNQLIHGAPSYDRDMSYVAERVLTLEELKTYVDHHADCGPAVRDLLARRLARAGRYAEAIPYYSADSVRSWAKDYRKARDAGAHSTSAGERAEAWYKVAHLEIVHGMELRGTALAPDYAIFAGNYALGHEDNEPSDIASSDEKRRQRHSSVRPHRRFHYRAVAVEHLLLAASNLPPRSPAMSALLCTGAHWLRKHGETPDGVLVTKLYHRYQEVGQFAPWDRNFGAECPEPQFPAW